MNQNYPTTIPPLVAPKNASEAVSAKSLLGNGSVLVIEHSGERYQLRLTRNGKLILTK